jgi:hypothetical protein
LAVPLYAAGTRCGRFNKPVEELDGLIVCHGVALGSFFDLPVSL